MPKTAEFDDHVLIDTYIRELFNTLNPQQQASVLDDMNVRDLDRWLRSTRSLPTKRALSLKIRTHADSLSPDATSLLSARSEWKLLSQRTRRILGVDF